MSITKLWIVVGCISALVIIAIIQAGCTIYRTSRKPVKHHKVSKPTSLLVIGNLIEKIL